MVSSGVGFCDFVFNLLGIASDRVLDGTCWRSKFIGITVFKASRSTPLCFFFLSGDSRSWCCAHEALNLVCKSFE